MPDVHTAAYWEGAARHQLLIVRCAACGFFIHPPRQMCPRCLSEAVRPVTVSGRGRVYSYSIMHNRGNPGFDEALPYAVVVVELDEQPGLFMISNLLNCPLDQITIGMAVRVVFERAASGVTLPQFEPA
jgi:uncharacterized OB-fold protein